jgi:hypothetical protein
MARVGDLIEEEEDEELGKTMRALPKLPSPQRSLPKVSNPVNSNAETKAKARQILSGLNIQTSEGNLKTLDEHSDTLSSTGNLALNETLANSDLLSQTSPLHTMCRIFLI